MIAYRATYTGGLKNEIFNTFVESSVNNILASCPWGPVTANGVDILTEMYVIYMKRKTYLHTKNEAPRSNGLGATGVH